MLLLVDRVHHLIYACIISICTISYVFNYPKWFSRSGSARAAVIRLLVHRCSAHCSSNPNPAANRCPPSLFQHGPSAPRPHLGRGRSPTCGRRRSSWWRRTTSCRRCGRRRCRPRRCPPGRWRGTRTDCPPSSPRPLTWLKRRGDIGSMSADRGCSVIQSTVCVCVCVSYFLKILL